MLGEQHIIYQDEFFVALNKPAGLLVHPSSYDKSETESALKQLRDLTGKWVFPIHRLDKPTSGILLFAFSNEAARKLCDLFTDKKIIKTYLALVRGYTKEHEIIDYPLKKIWDKMTDKNSMKNQPPQDAKTEYRRLFTFELAVPVHPHPTSRYSIIEVTPHTGRLRQIRRHMKHIFHPILGDHKHGDNSHNRMFADRFGLDRLMLHAHSLSFSHPETGVPLFLKARPADDFIMVIEKTGFADLAAFRKIVTA
jgi:tRNA pseudouridine65 synthase